MAVGTSSLPPPYIIYIGKGTATAEGRIYGRASKFIAIAINFDGDKNGYDEGRIVQGFYTGKKS